MAYSVSPYHHQRDVFESAKNAGKTVLFAVAKTALYGGLSVGTLVTAAAAAASTPFFAIGFVADLIGQALRIPMNELFKDSKQFGMGLPLVVIAAVPMYLISIPCTVVGVPLEIPYSVSFGMCIGCLITWNEILKDA